jgi:hypothetical protein
LRMMCGGHSNEGIGGCCFRCEKPRRH